MHFPTVGQILVCAKRFQLPTFVFSGLKTCQTHFFTNIKSRDARQHGSERISRPSTESNHLTSELRILHFHPGGN
jgi:hypothetical protein